MFHPINKNLRAVKRPLDLIAQGVYVMIECKPKKKTINFGYRFKSEEYMNLSLENTDDIGYFTIWWTLYG